MTEMILPIGFDLVAAIFGEMSILSRLVYILVGLSAMYDIVAIKAIWKRWECTLAHPLKFRSMTDWKFFYKNEKIILCILQRINI